MSRARAASGWLVTPMQAIIGRRSNLKYRLYFGAGGLAFGLLVGIVQGIRIGHQRDDAAPAEGAVPAGGAGLVSARSARAGTRSSAGRPYRLRRVIQPPAPQAAPATQAAPRP